MKTITTASTKCLSIGVAAVAVAGIAMFVYAIPLGFFGGPSAVSETAAKTTTAVITSKPQSYALTIASHKSVAAAHLSSISSSRTTTTTIAAATATRTDVSKTAALIHQQINDERTIRGMKPLLWDTALAKIAADHSKDMAVRNYFSHDDPEGHRYTYRYAVAGYVCQRSSGENIFWMGTSSPSVSEKISRTKSSRCLDA